MTRTTYLHNFIGWAYGGIIEARGGLISKWYLTPAEFLSRASVTAKELRLVPVAEKWVPKVGDWVVVTAKSGLFLRGHISKVCRTGPQGGVYLNQPNMADGCCVERKHLRPATEQEIAAHLAEQEAKKPVEFGTRVECRGKTYRIIADNPDTLGFYPMYCNDARAVFHAKRSEFTIID